MLDLIITNGLVSLEAGTVACDVGIKGGRVAGLYDPGTAPPAPETIDATGLRVLPGFVDVHYHCNGVPDGLREDMQAATGAAAAGGTTTICQMPVAEPFTIRERAEAMRWQAHVDMGLWAFGGATKEEIYQAADDGAIAYKMFMLEPRQSSNGHGNPKLQVGSGVRLYESMKLASSTGRRVGVHCEDQSLIEPIQAEIDAAGRVDPLAHQDSKPPVVEISAVAKVLALAKHFGTRVHITHVTTNGVIPLIAQAKKDGTDVSAETCIHYLCFDSEIMKTAGPFARIGPPIRAKHQSDLLWPALRDGVLDMVSSDHAPYPLSQKIDGWKNIFLAANGAPGGEVRAPAILTEALKGTISFERAVEALSTAGAKAFDMYPKKGRIAPGSDGDLVLFDPTHRWTLKASEMITGARDVGLMYDGMEMQGKIVRTILRGKTIFLDGKVVGTPGDGEQVTPLGMKVAAAV